MTLIFGTTHAAPILNLFELGIQPGQTATYDAVGQNNINASVGNEAGTLAMYSVKQKITRIWPTWWKSTPMSPLTRPILPRRNTKNFYAALPTSSLRTKRK